MVFGLLQNALMKYVIGRDLAVDFLSKFVSQKTAETAVTQSTQRFSQFGPSTVPTVE